MGKRSRAAKRAARASLTADLVAQADLRSANGRATLEDVDFLTRMRRMADGKDGYSGDTVPLSQVGAGGYQSPQGYWRVPFTKGKDEGYDWHKASSVSSDKGGKGFKASPREDGVFCVESGEVEGACPLKPTVPSILIDARMWEVFLACTREYDTEWIALLIGALGADSKGQPAYVIERFYFPPQTATGTHVDVPIEARPRPGTIGAIHSHVGMSVFFSGTDKAHSNWPVEIVINRKREYEAVARHQLRCGEWAKSKTNVYLTGSFISARVKEQLDGAFKSGALLEKGRGRGSTTAIVTTPKEAQPQTQPPATQPPATQGGLFSGQVSTYDRRIENPSKFPPMPEGGPATGWDKPCATEGCGHSYYLHYWNSGTQSIHGCATTKCSCMKYTPSEPPDTTPLKGEEDKVTAQVPDDGSAIDSAIDTPAPLTPSELNPDPYACTPCEGDGWIETEVNGITEVVECPTCGGSGLNRAGLDMQATVGHQLM